MREQYLAEIKDLTDNFLKLKDENPVRYLEYLPDFLLDLFVIGVANKLGIKEKRPIVFWHRTLEKNKNREYNLKKVILGGIIFLIGNKLTKIKRGGVTGFFIASHKFFGHNSHLPVEGLYTVTQSPFFIIQGIPLTTSLTTPKISLNQSGAFP